MKARTTRWADDCVNEVDETPSQLSTSIDRKESPLESSCEPSTGPSTPPPPYALESSSAPVFSESANSLEDAGDSACRENLDPKSSEATFPVKYYIKPGDTLLGISLKYGIDVSDAFHLDAVNDNCLLSVRVAYCVV